MAYDFIVGEQVEGDYSMGCGLPPKAARATTSGAEESDQERLAALQRRLDSLRGERARQNLNARLAGARHVLAYDSLGRAQILDVPSSRRPLVPSSAGYGLPGRMMSMQPQLPGQRQWDGGRPHHHRRHHRHRDDAQTSFPGAPPAAPATPAAPVASNAPPAPPGWATAWPPPGWTDGQPLPGYDQRAQGYTPQVAPAPTYAPPPAYADPYATQWNAAPPAGYNPGTYAYPPAQPQPGAPGPQPTIDVFVGAALRKGVSAAAICGALRRKGYTASQISSSFDQALG